MNDAEIVAGRIIAELSNYALTAVPSDPGPDARLFGEPFMQLIEIALQSGKPVAEIGLRELQEIADELREQRRMRWVQ